MPFKPPKFWYEPSNIFGSFMEPVSWLYQLGAGIHQKISLPHSVSVPVISIGNFVLGGAGKTPVTMALADHLKSMGKTPHIISGGYGGNLKGPILVDPKQHHFLQVGDEPLLLSHVAPTWVSKNRATAARLAIQSGADILLLDDGHQNYTLKKDLCLMVVSAGQGFGNGRIFPAGPLRQSIRSGLKTTSAIIFIGPAQAAPLPPELDPSCPVIRATLTPLNPHPCEVIGFAGIGYPEKFRQTLEEAGYRVKDFISFPDHHPYTNEDIQKLKAKAHGAEASLITTEKDFMRISVFHRQDILRLPVQLVFQQEDALMNILKRSLWNTVEEFSES